MKEIIKLRHLLHSKAEISGQEIETNHILNKWIKVTQPDLIIERIGGYGLAALYKGKNPGKRILIRADIDALRIPESDTIEHHSLNDGVSHKCGHDGHAAILCGLAKRISSHRPDKGEIALLFQPAEEIGTGSKSVINDTKFQQIVPDVAYGLHNLPGFPSQQIVLKENCFAAASFGLKIIFEGRTAHASQPETGNSPVCAVFTMLQELEKKRTDLRLISPLTTFVVTHTIIGEETFGVAPGHAEIWLTLRSFRDANLESLYKEIASLCEKTAKDNSLEYCLSKHEAFSATNSGEREVAIIKKAAQSLNYEIQEIADPFKWSEDFGQFSSVCPIGFFGLGAGITQPPLHDSTYDFPDNIIETGINIFEEIIRQELA